jgi:CelD/BcsL family acetyltransferase involved in cellulose biosynthesis
MAQAQAWSATWAPLHDRQALAQEWHALERASNASFFLRWAWLGTLLECVEGVAAPRVLRVHNGGELRGLALVWRSRQSRHGFVNSRTLHLNETGRPEFDRVTIEHNGVLSAAGDEAAVLRTAARFLAGQAGWDECFLSGLDDPVETALQEAAAAHTLWYRQRWAKSFHFIDLNPVRQAGGDYPESLSANTRYQLRRAMKGYAALGPLACQRASSTSEALAWFEDLARLHQVHWAARDEPGAFSSPFTRKFHTTLIQRAWPLGAVSLLRVTAGTELLGYVYNFEQGGTAYNYQSGHVAASSNKLKPGLVVHGLAVQEALQRGLGTYDLLMGGDHFKPSLCNATGRMNWSVLQQPRLVLRLENRLRMARDRWQARRQPPPAAAAGPQAGSTA